MNGEPGAHAAASGTCAPPDPRPRPARFRMPAGAVDCHAHVFGPSARYPYHPERTYTPPDAPLDAYRHLHHVLGIERGVLVQPSVYGTDNHALADALAALRDQGLDYRGVAVVKAGVSDAELDMLAAAGIRGVRLNLLFRGGIEWPAVEQLAARLAEQGWHLQCLIDVSRCDDLEARFRALPVPVVVDHMGHAPAGRTLADPGFAALLRLMTEGKAWTKLSGPYRFTAEHRPPYRDVTPIARALIEANPERVVWGSDWPHPHIPVPMPEDGELLNMLADWAPDAELRRRILVENPERLYGFGDA